MKRSKTKSIMAYGQIMESNDEALNINSLRDEVLINIFSFLSQNELGQIARVCRRWNIMTRSPNLWKKVNVKFHWSHKSQITVAKCFVNVLPFSVTCIKLDFRCLSDWTEQLNFVELCVRLQGRCPHLKILILKYALLSASFPRVIDLCTHFLQGVEVLIFHCSNFPNRPLGSKFDIDSKIKILDVSCCYLNHYHKLQFSKLPCLKELCLYGTRLTDSWFNDGISFWNQLHVLNLGCTKINSRHFATIKNHGLNLEVLYLCRADLNDADINIDIAFPHLKTICLSHTWVTGEGVFFLIQSCPSLQNVYVDEYVAASFAAHPFVVDNNYNSGIVKAIKLIHDHNVEFLNN